MNDAGPKVEPYRMNWDLVIAPGTKPDRETEERERLRSEVLKRLLPPETLEEAR